MLLHGCISTPTISIPMDSILLSSLFHRSNHKNSTLHLPPNIQIHQLPKNVRIRILPIKLPKNLPAGNRQTLPVNPPTTSTLLRTMPPRPHSPSRIPRSLAASAPPRTTSLHLGTLSTMVWGQMGLQVLAARLESGGRGRCGAGGRWSGGLERPFRIGGCAGLR